MNLTLNCPPFAPRRQNSFRPPNPDPSNRLGRRRDVLGVDMGVDMGVEAMSELDEGGAVVERTDGEELAKELLRRGLRFGFRVGFCDGFRFGFRASLDARIMLIAF